MSASSQLVLVDRTLLAQFQQQLHTSIIGPTGPAGVPGPAGGPTGATGPLGPTGSGGGAAGAFTTVGPVGSGATYITDGTSDQVEINQAITAVSGAGGGVVQLMRQNANYGLSAAVRVKDNVILQGQGGGTKLFLANGANDNVITNDDHTIGNTNFQIRDLQFDGNGVNQSAGSGSGVVDALYFLFSTNFTVQQVFGQNGNRHNCFASDSCAQVRIVRNRFDNPIGLSNISAFNANDIIVSQNITSNATQTGVKLDSCHTTVISNNVFENNDTIQIYVTGGSSCAITGNAVRGGQNGIRVTSQDFTTISGNSLRSHSQDGIFLLQNCQGININGNMIRDIGQSDVIFNGITITDVGNACRDLLIANNTIIDSSGAHMKYGVQSLLNSDYIQYGSNVIKGFITSKYALVGANNSNAY